MLRDVFYYGAKPNAHPRERFAENLADARQKATTRDFWIINEFCDYRNFDWDFDFEFLPDEDVWAEDHNNVWPSQHQKDSGTWLCPKEHSDLIIYRGDVDPVIRKNEHNDNWVELDLIDHTKFDFSWHPDPTDPPYIYKWGCKFFPAELKHVLEYRVPGATQEKYMNTTVELLPQTELWIEHQEIDKHKFDLSWRPNPLDPPFIYVWGNKYIDGKLKPTLEYHMPDATDKKYMPELLDVLPEWDRWVEVEAINKNSFDFSWRPDPREPAFIYVFGNEQHDATIMPTLEYHCPDATEIKYVEDIKAKLAPKKELFEHLEDSYGIDYSWRPDPTSPPYIYAWGNQWNAPEDKISVQYVVPGATEYKYMTERAIRRPCMDNWIVPDNIDTTGFDFSWEPSPAAPPYIYEFATQWQKTGGPQYVVPGTTEKQYVDFQKVKRFPSNEGWTIPSNIDSSGFDFSWHPDDTSPPYVYVFATQWAFSGGPVYTVDGATEIKYVDDQVAIAKKDMTNWVYDASEIDMDSFDFSWHPYVEDQPYIYQFGTQWQKTGGPKYITPGADSSSPTKYIDTRIIKATRLPNPSNKNWKILNDYKIKEFDFSWHPDNTDEPYIYVFGNNLYPAEEMPTIEYHVPGAKQVKFVHDIVAILDQDTNNWVIPDNIVTGGFDFSWKPNPTDPPYVYEFGTQHQKTGGPRYVVPGATETKYLDFQTVVRTPVIDQYWNIDEGIDQSAFDFSWHPDATDPPYIYAWGNQWVKAEDHSSIEYAVPGATEYRYMGDTAVRLPDQKNWYIPDDVNCDDIDFSWEPSPREEPYIYQFGTQWQKTGGPQYVVEGATQVKYIDLFTAKKLPSPNMFNVLGDYKIKEFDYSWHPDETEEPYIYVFGNNLYPAEECATIEYRVPNATQVKYVHDIVATLDEDMTNWTVPENVNTDGFDFGWIPNPTEPPYIYEFATQWQKTGGPRYVVPGATEVKYVDTQKVTILPSKDNWTVPEHIDVSQFDFSWHPDSTEPTYIYQFGTQWTLTGGPTYTVPGATETKYIDVQVAKSLPNRTNWVYDATEIDVDSFDFSWHPYVEDQPYIYQFGTQHQKTGGPKYIVPGATKTKYVDTRIIKAKRLPSKDNWESLLPVDDFDYSWHPDETEEPYIYVFGNTQYSAEIMPTVQYKVEGATQYKYVNTISAKLSPNRDNWKLVEDIVEDEFDFSWVPNPKDPPYIYVFGNTQYPAEIFPTVEYHVPGATDKKYVNDTVAKLKANKTHFKILKPIVEDSFDFGWRPNPKDPPYIYVFGNNRYSAEEFPTVEYHVEGATDKKYVNDLIATLAPDKTNWEIPAGIDVKTFDFSWVPHPKSPPYIYQFGTKIDNNDGPRYITPNNNGEIVYVERVELEDVPEIVVGRYDIETTLEDLINEHPGEVFWATRKNIDYANFDFDWRPGSVEVAWELEYVHVFGSTDSEVTQTYFVSANHYLNGNTQFKFVEEIKLDETTLAKIFVKPDMFFVDRGNAQSTERFEQLKEKFGNKIQKTRYLNSWVDTINRCINRSTTELIWVLNSELDYSTFNFDYYPNPWQMKMVHVFGTQWSHWGTTFMVNREAFPEDTKYIKIIEHLSTLNFVKENRAIATDCVYDIVLIDHGNTETDKVLELLQKKAPNKIVTVAKYDQSYLNTIRNLVKRLPEKKEHYLWLCSSVCDYNGFDLSYICDPFARDNLHVFPSGKQKFGDTFFIDVNKTKEIIESMDSLEDYDKVNYNGTLKSNRLPAPEIVTSSDTLVDVVKNSLDQNFPYSIVMTSDNVDLPESDYEPLNLWANDTKNIIITTTGATRIVVPREAATMVSKELYDYPYIKRAPKLIKSNPLDIVFLSNGETGAEENWEHLLNVTNGLPNRVVRVDGVNGRAAAYHAAAEASETPWMFTVFAKLKVSPKFDWNWQPDRMQVPKHYIFHAKNPVNGLVYGHQAMIAYNKKLTLANEGRGLDFTLDDEHEIVPLISGTAHYNTDPFSTWRTAFREVLKLKADESEESRVRLEAWLNKAEGEYAQYSIKGAVDADEYFEEVDGDFDKLKLSYEWDWLRNKFEEL